MQTSDAQEQGRKIVDRLKLNGFLHIEGREWVAFARESRASIRRLHTMIGHILKVLMVQIIKQELQSVQRSSLESYSVVEIAATIRHLSHRSELCVRLQLRDHSRCPIRDRHVMTNVWALEHFFFFGVTFHATTMVCSGSGRWHRRSVGTFFVQMTLWAVFHRLQGIAQQRQFCMMVQEQRSALAASKNGRPRADSATRKSWWNHKEHDEVFDHGLSDLVGPSVSFNLKQA